ncbi:carcinoembryonic antigen-related cell adhesion molecule 1-like isoform X1 [Sardina pilchardus]|uniref:carcinoembryonic antigen-related cell adhesion molecule 1-like isoform X1 n=1 Tax=Sardina pilchardus TaxID=27697 RepID=UPI002E11EE93
MSFTLILMLLQFLSVTHSAGIQKHALRNDSTELNGEVPNVHVVSVLWTCEKDKVVDWDKGDTEPRYYTRLNKTKLNMDTWALTISDLQPTCHGRYALQINGRETAKSYQLTVLEPVSQPDISHACDPEGCNFTCKGADSTHTEYSWTDNQGRNERGSVLMVEKTEGLNGVYTCNFSNPVSWNTSSIREGELFSADATDAKLAIILGSITGLAALIGIACCIKKKSMHREAHVRQEQPEEFPLSTTNNQAQRDEPEV